MSSVRDRWKGGDVALGAWTMIPHPSAAEILAGEGVDWVGVDMEHASHDLQTLENAVRAVHGRGKDVLARLPAGDPVAAKQALDGGADGIIVPCVCTQEEARQAVQIAKFPPEGVRGASLARCTDYGRRFDEYFQAHNDTVIVVVMLEHVRAVENAGQILSTPGIDAAFIGPYDLSASMGLARQLDHPDVRAAQEHFLETAKRHGVAPGIHVVPVDPSQVAERIRDGYRFIALGLDTGFLIHGMRAMLAGAKECLRRDSDKVESAAMRPVTA
jgi:2-dehydro-3-deoxyglucarate aldolase